MRQILLFYNFNSIFMKKLYLFAALATMLAACSENDLTAEKQVVQQNAEEGAVQFGAYVNRGTTRAGWAGTLTTSTGTNNLQTEGFGVFGYYTNDELYSQNSKPEFFYNQKVYYDGGIWKYEPIKYWPNEFGATAESQAEDKLTFFAYAPYVPVDVNTGIAQQTKDGSGNPIDELETGIISLTRNTTLGDPYVKYYASFDPEKCVDLCFGVAKEAFTSSVDGNYNTVKAGMPYVDVKKPKLNDKIFFDFKHALAQLNVQIDADVDVAEHMVGDVLDGSTKIFVREVTFEGFADKGMLNLYSETVPGEDYTPKWVDLSGINEIKSGKVTIYDGRRDGREGQVNASAPNEKPQNLNPEIISNEGNGKPGVPANELVNLFAGNAKNSPILVIPTGEPLSVTIVYDVETEDKNLASFLSDGRTHGSSVENKITKSITIGNEGLKLIAGKSYIVKLHLGMNSVKFDAGVTEWVDASDADVDLPSNVPVYAVKSTNDIVLPANVDEFQFAISGLNGGETVTVTPTNPVSGPVAPKNTFNANASGVALITVSLTPNSKVAENKAGKINISSNAGTTTINVKQSAAPLGLNIKSVDFGDKAITIAPGDGITINWTSDIKAIATDIKVLKNGTALTTKEGTVAPTDNKDVHWDKSTAKLFFADAMQPGDTYTITVKAGDAEKETVVYKVKTGSLSFPAPKVEVKKGETPIVNTLTQEGDGTVAYTSSNTTVADVDASSGAITIKAAGITTITATVSGSTCLYPTTTATYTIVVYDKYDVVANTQDSGYTKESISVGSEGGEGYFIISGFYSGEISTVVPVSSSSWVTIISKEITGTELKVNYKVKNKTFVSSRSADITVETASHRGVIVTVNQ
jgi:hypothetical protein